MLNIKAALPGDRVALVRASLVILLSAHHGVAASPRARITVDWSKETETDTSLHYNMLGRECGRGH